MFSGFLYPCETEKEFSDILTSKKNEHPNATHHCYAYRLNPHNCIEFSSDDGEPSGSAGNPILNTLRSFKLINIAMIVVRYYGGTKLGKSGLIDAYRETTIQTIKASKTKTLIPVKQFKITYNYEHQSIIEKLKHSFTLFETESEYLEYVTVTFACPLDESEIFEKNLLMHEHIFESIESLEPSLQIL